MWKQIARVLVLAGVFFPAISYGQGISGSPQVPVIVGSTPSACQTGLLYVDVVHNAMWFGGSSSSCNALNTSAGSGFPVSTSVHVVSGGTITIDSGGTLTCAAGSTCPTSAVFSAITSGTNTTAAMVVGTGASLATTGSGTIVATSTSGNSSTATTATNMSGGALGSVSYQSAANTSAFLASPTTSGHTFAFAWTPSGSALAPTALDLATYLASPPAIGGTAPGVINFTQGVSTGTGPWMSLTERANAITPAAGFDICDQDSTAHAIECSFNGAAVSPVLLLSTSGTAPSLSIGGTAATATAPASVPWGYANGGTNGTTQATARNNMFPCAVEGSIAYWASSAAACLATGTSSQVLVGGTDPAYGNVPAAALPAPTVSAEGGTYATPVSQAISKWNNGSTADSATVTQNQIRLYSYPVSVPVNSVKFGYYVQTADNTANVYDIGIYGPGCLGGATNVPLVVHTGPTAGSTIFASTSLKGPVNWATPAVLQPGWYCIAYTSSGATPAAVFGGGSTATLLSFAEGTVAAQTSSSGTLPSTITAPATSYTVSTAVTNLVFLTWGP